MNEKLTSNNLENDAFNLNAKENDYNNLISKLKEIRTNIDLLEKTIFR